MSEPSAKRRRIADNGGTRVTDPRFANIQSDPRYRLPSKKHKVKLDRRFTQKFRDEDFTRRAKVDRYGRRIEDDAAERRLRAKFDLEEEDEDEDDEPDDDDQVQAELARVEKSHDPLRDGKDISSSEDESSTDEDSESDEEDVAEDASASQREEVPLGEVSTRMAVVNLDWDNIRATDLMAVFSSFLPAGGRLLRVTIYPSEFGKERIEREEMEGPPKEIFAQNQDEEESESDKDMDDQDNDEEIKASIIKPDDGSEFDSQALRQYQLERLRYYYAVLTFSSKQVAKSIYDAVDGAEYLSTANFFDLRFIPEDMDFFDDRPRDECDHLPSGYRPNEFVTDALQHSKVKLTWDAEDRGRKEAQARAFKGGQKEIDENDLRAYLGSDSSGEEEDEEDNEQEHTKTATKTTTDAPTQSKKELERQKARALLGLAPEPAKRSTKKDKDSHVGDIQITFSSGLSGAASTSGESKKRPVFENSPEPEETTVEKYRRKERERKQMRKEKMKAARAGLDDATATATAADGDQGTPTADKDIPASNNNDEELGFDDPFFADAVTDARQSNKVRKEERLKKRQEREAEEAASARQRAELELLMADDDDEESRRSGAASQSHVVKHFDMAEIEKAEKGRNKWQKRKDRKTRTGDDAGVQMDDFEMDTTDARFGNLFQNHEFAIDPTRPGLRQTKGMKALMEAGRRRKLAGPPGRGPSSSKSAADEVVDTRGSVNRDGEKAHRQDGGGGRIRKGEMNEDVRDLVAKIKRKGDRSSM